LSLKSATSCLLPFFQLRLMYVDIDSHALRSSLRPRNTLVLFFRFPRPVSSHNLRGLPPCRPTPPLLAPPFVLSSFEVDDPLIPSQNFNNCWATPYPSLGGHSHLVEWFSNLALCALFPYACPRLAVGFLYLTSPDRLPAPVRPFKKGEPIIVSP